MNKPQTPERKTQEASPSREKSPIANENPDEANEKLAASEIKPKENLENIKPAEPGGVDLNSRIDLKENPGIRREPSQVMESRNKLQTEDESLYKITRQQHEEILKFVNEKKKAVLGGMVALNQNLSKNIKEDEKLPLIIEDIKNGNKDIENCLDDVMSYRFDNDKDYILALVDCSSIIKRILHEFGTYKKNLKTYSDFKNEMMVLLNNYDPNNPENRALYLSAYMSQYSARQPRDERVHSSIPFIPKEESMHEMEDYNTNMMEDQIDLRLELR